MCPLYMCTAHHLDKDVYVMHVWALSNVTVYIRENQPVASKNVFAAFGEYCNNFAVSTLVANLE